MKICLDCGRPCSRNAQRCKRCSNRRHRAAARGIPRPESRKPKPGVPVVAADGIAWMSVAALARAIGCAPSALYRYARWERDHWVMQGQPDPRNIGSRTRRKRETYT
jgi:hypothetical protein